MTGPLANHPLRTREDVQAAVRALFAPLAARFSRGGARVSLGSSGAHFSNTLAELEGFARPLWGVAPLAAGGGDFGYWDLYRRGLASGCDPDHPEYWGDPGDGSQHLVEMAALGVTLALAPEQAWDPLPPGTRGKLAAWLGRINTARCGDNNWLMFRVMVNLGLERVGAPHDLAACEAQLERLEGLYLGGGWYADGPITAERAQIDYYGPFAIHFYSLIYAALAGKRDTERAALFLSRGAAFARDFMTWFAPRGAALPFGRSLTYRFALGAFWGALSFAADPERGVEGISWGILRGVWLRHLREWAARPIFHGDGVLSVGYGYANLNMAESYNSPQSPYWAMKFFLPLALGEDHPFWTAREEALPDLPAVSPQPHPGLVLCRDEARGHVFALSGRQHALWLRHGAEKYAKFAYSTHFAFSVPGGRYGPEQGAFDSTLALSEDGTHFRVRERPLDFALLGEAVYTRWSAFPGVEVETWLLPALPWHVRVHRLVTNRPLHSLEGGWALDRTGDDVRYDHRVEDFSALALSSAGASGLCDLLAGRSGTVVRAEPNTNLLHPRTVIPTLAGEHAPGTHWLACAVLGLPGTDAEEAAAVWADPPRVTFEGGTPVVYHLGRTTPLHRSIRETHDPVLSHR